MENKEASQQETWISSCCRKDAQGQVSKGLLRFLTTAFFTTLLISFAMFKLSGQNIGAEEKAIYFSLLSSCVATYLPAPSPHDPPPSSFPSSSHH